MNTPGNAVAQETGDLILRANILGIGLRLYGYKNLESYLSSDYVVEAHKEFVASLATDSMSVREKRRAPTAVLLAMDVAHQACAMAGINASEPLAVFSSGFGDTDTLSAMYDSTAQTDPFVSPTVFHNSVHNAASGYWSINANNHNAITFVSAGNYSFSAALLDALLLVNSQDKPVLLVLYDVASPKRLASVHAVERPFAAAFLLANTHHNDVVNQAKSDAVCLALSASRDYKASDWPVPRPRNDALQNPSASAVPMLYETNPVAKCLGLLDAFCAEEAQELSFPLSDQSSLLIKLARSAL